MEHRDQVPPDGRPLRVFYGSAHLLIYIVFDRYPGADYSAGLVAIKTLKNVAVLIGQDIYKRPFITVGFSAWLSMLPLALTSTTGWIRRLGGKRWNALPPRVPHPPRSA